jgi:tetratricopeptide (TPR) repeat protein
MKPIFRTLLLCLIPLSLLHAQEKEAADAPKHPHEVAFSNLPEAKRKEFTGKLNEARRLFGEKRVFEALDKAKEASAIFPDDPGLVNLIGACHVEFRNFDKAMECFKKADSLTPDNAEIVFNIAELNFVTKNWEEAERTLTRVLELAPASNKSQFQLSRLTEFKLLLVKLKLNKAAEAATMAAKYDYLDDSPYPYYAQAAIHFSKGKEMEAEAEMARAGRIFQDPNAIAPWQDTMIEFGYVKGFFGGDEAESK